MLCYPTAKLWAPDKIPNCVLWLDANDLSTIITVSGAVSSWNSKVGNFQAIQDNNATRPLLTQYAQRRNTIFFDGIDDFLQIPSSSFDANFVTPNFTIAMSVIFTRVITGTVGAQHIITKRTALTNGFTFSQLAAANGIIFDWGGNSGRITTPNPALNQTTTYILARNSSNRRLARNGVTVIHSAGTSNPNITSNLFIGSTQTPNNFLQGTINEIIMYQSALSDTELNKLAGYLHWKWLNPEVLPVSNIYRETVPKTIN